MAIRVNLFPLFIRVYLRDSAVYSSFFSVPSVSLW